MANTSPFKGNPGLFLVVTYLVLLIINALVIYLASLIAPAYIVLGTAHLTIAWALMLSAGKLALLDTFAIPFVRHYELESKRMFKTSEWMILYFVLNFAGLWLIGRFSNIYGLGLSSWFVAAVLAVILDFAQGIGVMQLEKYRPE